MNSNRSKIKSIAWVSVIGLISIFSGCNDKNTIKPPSTCPQFEIYELPDKVNLREIQSLGKTIVKFDFNSTITQVNVGAKGANPEYLHDYAIVNGVISPMGLIVDIIDYTSDLRTIIEKSNAEKEIHQDSNSSL